MSKTDLKTSAAHARAFLKTVVKPFEHLEEVISDALEAESRLGGLHQEAATLQETITGLRGQIADLQGQLAVLGESQAWALKENDRQQRLMTKAVEDKKEGLRADIAAIQAERDAQEAAAQQRLNDLAVDEHMARERVEALKEAFATLRQSIPA